MTTEEQDDKKRAKDQAKAQLESITSMVMRLEHVQECSDAGCGLSDEQIYEGLGIFYLGEKASEEEREQYHNNEEATQAIAEDPLSVEVHSDWHTPGEENKETEYKILLCTGGPAVQIVGDLGVDIDRETVDLEFQDWFT